MKKIISVVLISISIIGCNLNTLSSVETALEPYLLQHSIEGASPLYTLEEVIEIGDDNKYFYWTEIESNTLYFKVAMTYSNVIGWYVYSTVYY